jgi:hypothetical protein
VSVLSHIVVLAIIVAVSVGFGYLLGWRRCKRAHGGVLIIYSIPRDDVDIDVPRKQDARRWMS